MMKKNKNKKEPEQFSDITDALKKLYEQRLLPLEQAYKFHDYHSPPMEPGDFEARPTVLLIGQYSTGKTTFINHLLGEAFPGSRIGPEPTTDNFVAVMHGESRAIIPGNVIVSDQSKPFRPLSMFGNAFLSKFQVSVCPNDVLRSCTIIDTPGILSGDKHRTERGYNFASVVEWFAERVDRIVLLFDANKLDISDEFKRTIEVLKGQEEKIRIVLNKADHVNSQQLMRVYGALMWSLSRVLYAPEVARVYIGSWWDQPLQFDTNRELFDLEQSDLKDDIAQLPKSAALRKVNDLIKRARLAQVHCYILNHLRTQMPAVIGKDSKKRELITHLQDTYAQVSRQYKVSMGDFPKLDRMQNGLQAEDFTKLPALKQKLIDAADEFIRNDIAKLMPSLTRDKDSGNSAEIRNGDAVQFLRLGKMGGSARENSEGALPEEVGITGGLFDHTGVDRDNTQLLETNPFAEIKATSGINEGKFDDEWICMRKMHVYEQTFQELDPSNGTHLSGQAAKNHMKKSKIPVHILGRIWQLSDVDKDGRLDLEEFALCEHLCQLALDGAELPRTLPSHLMPPSKRD